ncbi:hypothetical protein [Deinococcus altitudinis]|uniref:hypothetical protein n=1 Tax=Deinococcus altitudinis TaxID=468914 RepID=UPI003891DD1A
MKKPLTLSLLLLTMSAPAFALAQTPTASQTPRAAQAALTQARAALAQAQAARAAQSPAVKTAVKASSSLAQAQIAAPAATTPAPATPAPVTPGQTAAKPATWTNADLQAATYVVLAPSLEGNPGALSADQQKSVLVAMQHDLQGAVLRKYPTAKFVTDASTPGVITLRPVLTVPGSLLPWNSFQARVELSQNGGNAVVQDNFGVLEVYQHQADAANYLFDRLVGKLP